MNTTFAQATMPADGRAPWVAYILLTLAFLALGVLILEFIRSYETKLILLGLVCAVIATGYTGMVPMSAALAPGLMKIGVILVLGGVACSLMSYLRGSPPAAEGWGKRSDAV